MSTEMKTREQVLEAIASGERESQAIDDRDFSRLVDFFPVSDWHVFGFSLKEGAQAPPVVDWTRENILAQLARDLDFAFEKALDQRGLSASSMYEVVKMWMWVMNDELADFEGYAQYGLPLLKAVAMKYGLKNEIGDDTGTEAKYACD